MIGKEKYAPDGILFFILAPMALAEVNRALVAR